MIPLTKPVFDRSELDAVRRTLESGWVTQGPEVEAFERELAAEVGAPYACAVSSCTTALQLALRAVGVGPGDEVITASHSYIASANAIRHQDGIPVFVDIEPGTFNIDPVRIESAITPSTKAILCIHQMGMPCDLAAIVEIGARHGLPVVEDAACAIGSEIRWQGDWQRIGRPHAAVACFSFHPRKILTTGDGGMLTTDNPEYDRKFRLWRQHGMSISDATRHRSKTVTFESYEELGYNYRLTDIQAAIGRSQLKRLPELIERRRALAARYRSLLARVPGVQPPEEPAWARSNWQSYCLRLPPGADQSGVMQSMLDRGVATRRGTMCSHREPAYETSPWSCGPGPGGCGCATRTCRLLRHSEEAQDECVLLPLYHQMTESHQDQVVEALAHAL